MIIGNPRPMCVGSFSFPVEFQFRASTPGGPAPLSLVYKLLKVFPSVVDAILKVLVSAKLFGQSGDSHANIIPNFFKFVN